MAPDPDNPADPDKPRVLIRSDTAGATHRFAQACRTGGVGFSFGYPVDVRVQDAVDTLNIGDGWYPAIDTDGDIVTGPGLLRPPTWSTWTTGLPGPD